MTTPDSNYRIQQWRPPERPEWVRRVNEEGACMDLRGVVPLDENSLLATARANTGLQDFGADDWYEPFRLYIRSLEEEAGLNLMGRLMTRSELLMYLEARLRIEDTYQRHPEIEDQELAPPVLITGSGRSGTSALQNLMAMDPDNGTPRHWEALFPCPPPEAASYHSDPRIAVADRRMTQYDRVCPSMAAIHEWGGEMPTELIQLEAPTFQSPGWMIFGGFTPSWDAYIYGRADHLPVLRYVRRVLKLLQWKNPRKRWLLKDPDSLRVLPETLQVFPDLELIWIHRDPLKTISSVISLVGTILWTRSDRPLSDKAVAQLTNPDALAGLFDQVIDLLESGQIPASQVHHVQYVDFVEDPLAQVERIYGAMGIELTDAARQAMSAYLREHPRGSRPAHRYNVGDPERFAVERKLFERYMSYFGVSPET